MPVYMPVYIVHIMPEMLPSGCFAMLDDLKIDGAINVFVAFRNNLESRYGVAVLSRNLRGLLIRIFSSDRRCTNLGKHRPGKTPMTAAGGPLNTTEDLRSLVSFFAFDKFSVGRRSSCTRKSSRFLEHSPTAAQCVVDRLVTTAAREKGSEEEEHSVEQGFGILKQLQGPAAKKREPA